MEEGINKQVRTLRQQLKRLQQQRQYLVGQVEFSQEILLLQKKELSMQENVEAQKEQGKFLKQKPASH